MNPPQGRIRMCGSNGFCFRCDKPCPDDQRVYITRGKFCENIDVVYHYCRDCVKDDESLMAEYVKQRMTGVQ